MPSFEEFGKSGIQQIVKDVSALDVEMHRAVHAELATELYLETPIDLGTLLKGWGSTVDVSSKMSTQTALARIQKPGMKSAVVNTAGHATVIDMAVLGNASLQAPRGMSKPALATVQSRMDDIRAKVIAKVSK